MYLIKGFLIYSRAALLKFRLLRRGECQFHESSFNDNFLLEKKDIGIRHIRCIPFTNTMYDLTVSQRNLSFVHTHSYMNACTRDYPINTGPLKGISSQFCIGHAHKWEATVPPVHRHKNACFKDCYYILTYEYIIEKYISYKF